jgi:hypothetical protein
MRHNKNYQHAARELMRRRLADLVKACPEAENWVHLRSLERGQSATKNLIHVKRAQQSVPEGQ